jgi:hypothetical protein
VTRNDLDVFERLFGQLQGVYEELSVLSKKAPNDAVNKFKLSFINGVLADANAFLGAAYVPFKDFASFEVDSLPQYSDIVFILAQYIKSFEKYRDDNVVNNHGSWDWAIKAQGTEKGDDSGLVYVRSVMPKRLRYEK